ncbi:MAG: chaperone modulator CbpM [Desulfovibrionaceae bacterium]|nr:chaperone modulator CbpM [Desulfovibrionaceae bacterium]
MSDIICREKHLPAASELLSRSEFLELTGLAESLLQELEQLDWLSLVRTRESVLFSGRDVYRTRKLARLCEDFELPALGGSIVVDLLERIDELEREVARLRHFS